MEMDGYDYKFLHKKFDKRCKWTSGGKLNVKNWYDPFKGSNFPEK